MLIYLVGYHEEVTRVQHLVPRQEKCAGGERDCVTILIVLPSRLFHGYMRCPRTGRYANACRSFQPSGVTHNQHHIHPQFRQPTSAREPSHAWKHSQTVKYFVTTGQFLLLFWLENTKPPLQAGTSAVRICGATSDKGQARASCFI